MAGGIQIGETPVKEGQIKPVRAATSRVTAHIRNQWMGALALFLVLTGGSAMALGGTNTVFSDDIVNQEVKGADIKPNAVTGGKVANGSLSALDLADGGWTFLPETPKDCADGHFCRTDVPGFPGVFNEWGHNSTDPSDPWGRVGYYRDRVGIVHLRGLARCRIVDSACQDFHELPIFQLPVGYRPPNRMLLFVGADQAPHRLDILANGRVVFMDGANNASIWVSFDNISFRCSPPGANGCP